MAEKKQGADIQRNVLPKFTPPTSDALLRFRDVAGQVGLGRSTVYARMASGDFPQPVRLSKRCVRWRSSDIQAFIAGQAS